MNRACLFHNIRAFNGSFYLMLAVICLFLSCLTIGRNFATHQVINIHIGKTTQQEVEALFGPAWRTGIEDGKRTWTYAKYRYSLFSQTSTQDLVVRFDDAGVVSSFTFNTTDTTQINAHK